MNPIDIIRAWKDEHYRRALDPEALASLPPNPAGAVELGDAELSAVAGGRPYITNRTCTIRDVICCSSGPLCQA